MKVIQTPLPSNQYYAEEVEKKQIILHHTVSDPTSAVGDINSWLSTPDRIATNTIIGFDGTINKCFPSNMWGSHLGIKADWLKKNGFKDYGYRNVLLDKASIAVEIDAWGGLVLGTGKTIQFGSRNNQFHFVNTIKDRFYNAYGNPISEKLEVVQIDWRGFKYFQKYGKLQIEAVCELLKAYMSFYNIPKYGIVNGNINLSIEAISGKPGIWSHTSYREDKSDIYPDKDLFKELSLL